MSPCSTPVALKTPITLLVKGSTTLSRQERHLSDLLMKSRCRPSSVQWRSQASEQRLLLHLCYNSSNSLHPYLDTATAPFSSVTMRFLAVRTFFHNFLTTLKNGNHKGHSTQGSSKSGLENTSHLLSCPVNHSSISPGLAGCTFFCSQMSLLTIPPESPPCFVLSNLKAWVTCTRATATVTWLYALPTL